MRSIRTHAAATHHHGYAARWIFRIAGLGIVSLASCANPQAITSKEDNLAAAGFIARPAVTPEQQAMFHKLPAGRFLQRAGGETYVFADPFVCNCLYIGTKANYTIYVTMAQQKRLASEEQFKAQMYEDSSWNWGPWAPGIAGYGF